ncbi:MAG: DUF4091 domain-containing protein [Chitinophagaceae bacterium]|nr:DUF4091 domain-containing protein [Chitinophagaceae bacterium]
MPHYQAEYTFDKSTDTLHWQQAKPGLQVSFAATDEAYFRTELPTIPVTQSLKETGWKGERVNAMVLLWCADSINQVRFVLNDLKSSNGNVLSKSNFKLNMVRYVISNYPYNAKEVTCGEGPVDKAYLMPDRLEAFDRFDIPGKTVRPAWLTADIPATTLPGTYSGSVEVRSEKQTVVLTISIKVQDQMLPKPHDWTFRLDLWQNPWVLAEYYNVKPWSAEHKILLKKHLEIYAGAGGKYITTYAVHSPWSDNSYRLEGTMIEWIKTKNGKWKFDYNIFDQYVQLAIAAGIDKAITIYTPIPWGERFRYIDETAGNYITEQWPTSSAVFKINWNLFLTDLKAHLEKKGWLGKTYIGINENEMEQTLAAIKMVKQHSSKWKITYAGNWHPQLDSLLDDYSCVYGNEPAVSEVSKRAAAGQSSTYYICCTPAKPNTFVFSPPAEGRWLGWYAKAYGYDGMLRWAYDAWVADPARDARHIFWPAGDAYMVYPGAASSIRFEKMREGIVDFEKLKILQAKATRSTNAAVKNLAALLEQHLKSFIGEKEFDTKKIINDLAKGKKIMDELSDQLSR